MAAGDGISFGTRKRCTACNGLGWLHVPPSPLPAPQRPPAPAGAFSTPPTEMVTDWLDKHTHTTNADAIASAAISMGEVESSDDGFFMADDSREFERGRDFVADTSVVAARNVVPVGERVAHSINTRVVPTRGRAYLGTTTMGFMPDDTKGGGGTFAMSEAGAGRPGARRRELGRQSVYSSNNSAVQRAMAGLKPDVVQSIATHAMSLDEMLLNNAQVNYNGVVSFRTA